MQVSILENQLKLTFNYNENLIKKVKGIPGARFNKDMLEAFWTIPVSSLAYAKNKKIINEGHLYPFALKHVARNLYSNISVEVKADRLMAKSSNLYSLKHFQMIIKTLCSYSENIDNKFVTKTLAQAIYFKDNVLVIAFPKGLYNRHIEFLKLFNFKDLKIHPMESEKNLENIEAEIFNVVPRTYQEKAYMKIEKGEIPNRATLVMATGAGKTILSALITASLKVPTIFYVYSTDLLQQTVEVYEEVLQQEVGRIGGNRFTIKPITIASLQTAYSCYERQDKRWDKLKNYLDSIGLMFVDEGHMLGAETIYTVSKITDAPYSYALTATPFREDGKELFIEAATGPTVELISEDELVRGGYILPVDIEMVAVKHYPTKTKNYRKLYDKEIVDDWGRHRAVINAIKRYPDKQVIVLVNDIRHGRKIQDNLNCPFIHGSSNKIERTSVIEKFKNKQIDLMIASSILKQGIDLPEAEVLVLAHGGASIVELLQKIGRVRRPAPNKKAGIIIDFYDYVMPKTDNDVFRKQAEKRLALYNEKKFNIKWI